MATHPTDPARGPAPGPLPPGDDRAPAPRPGGTRGAGDACPGALRLHTAADGALARVRLPGGELAAAALTALADAARDLGDGTVGLTARGNVELRGLADDCGGTLAARLSAAGLLPSERHERIRNIAVSSLTGLDGGGLADLRPAVRQLDGLLCADLGAARLSGRFLFALDDGRGDTAGLDPDVKILSLSGGRAALVLAALDTGVRVAGADAARCAHAAAREFLAARDEHGWEVWRIAELPGAAGVLADRMPAALERAGVPHRVERAAVRTPCAEGRTGRGPAVRPGIVAQDGGRRAAVVAGARFGLLDARACGLLAGAAERDGDGTLRTTPWRSVVVPGLAPGAARRWTGELASAGLLLDPASPWTGATACTGTPGCARSCADVRALTARALDGDGGGAPTGGADAAGTGAADVPQPPGGLLPVHVSGCERRCGHPRTGWVDVLAAGDDAYLVTVRRRSRFAAGWADQPEAASARRLRAADVPDAMAAARRAPG